MMVMLYYTQSPDQTIRALESQPDGLDETTARQRLSQHGPNTIRVKSEPLWRKLVEPFMDVFMLVLFVAAAISLLHGDRLDAIIILGIMAISAMMYYIQRFSTERVLRSLRQQHTDPVSVLRDGRALTLDPANLVPGDIINLSEGERIPADARVLEAHGLRVDESLLTGESVPISKTVVALEGEHPIYEQTPMLFQGAFVVAGQARAIVTTTGNQTEFGRLAALATPEGAVSPVQKKIDRLIRQIIAVIAGVAIVAFVLALGGGMNLADSLRFVMALAVSAVPEGLPVAISVVLVLGMRRMAARKALVRTMRSIETVGVITTIATDKTGTLTKNQLTVQETWHPEGGDTKALLALTEQAINRGSHDPVDQALARAAEADGAILADQPVASLPFDQAQAMSGNLWQHESGYRLVVKGAPEALLDRADLTSPQRQAANQALAQLTAQGYRVIAVGQAQLRQAIDGFGDLPADTPVQLAGFLAVADILRPEASQAIKAALGAGVTVRMITGDHAETAYAIAAQLGMVTRRDQVFDSRRMSDMSDQELAAIIDNVRVFARVLPENKHRILTLLKQHNITAMTGDGVNDVPALANAHVGVAMGSGSQIAKDAGDIILLDDNFKTLIDAMREGRTIIANVRRMLFYLLSTNTGEVLTMLGALAVGLPAPLAPVQILWINLVTDTSMVIPLGLEPGERDIMRRRPAAPDAPILGRSMIVRMVLVAVSMAALTLGYYLWYLSSHGAAYAGTIAFCVLAVMQWSNAFNARSDHESIWLRLRTVNRSFYIGLALAVGLQVMAVFGPLAPLLHIAPVSLGDVIATSAVAFVVPIIVSEAHKWWCRRSATPGTADEADRPTPDA